MADRPREAGLVDAGRGPTPNRVETVCVLGDLMVDVIVRIPHEPSPGTDTPASISTHPGGAAGNVAEWLGRLDVPVSLIGCVGDDAFGIDALRSLSEAGVRTHVTRDPERRTGMCVALVTPNGERTMMPDLGANAGLRPENLTDEALVARGHLHISGYSLLHTETRMVALGALDVARRREMTVSVDASSVDPLRDAGAETFLGWIRPCSILFANAAEAEALTGLADPERAAQALLAATGLAVVKLGPDGALVAHGDAIDHRPAITVDSDELDTTGAGDAFSAGFLSVWVRGGGVEAALESGLATAARAVSGVGARP